MSLLRAIDKIALSIDCAALWEDCITNDNNQ